MNPLDSVFLLINGLVNRWQNWDIISNIIGHFTRISWRGWGCGSAVVKLCQFLWPMSLCNISATERTLCATSTGAPRLWETSHITLSGIPTTSTLKGKYLSVSKWLSFKSYKYRGNLFFYLATLIIHGVTTFLLPQSAIINRKIYQTSWAKSLISPSSLCLLVIVLQIYTVVHTI